LHISRALYNRPAVFVRCVLDRLRAAASAARRRRLETDDARRGGGHAARRAAAAHDSGIPQVNLKTRVVVDVWVEAAADVPFGGRVAQGA
jgi:hypothetical protein